MTSYAVFRDAQSAKAAISALKGFGVKPENVTLMSRSVDAARRPPEPSQDFGALSQSFPDLRVTGAGNPSPEDPSLRMEDIAATAGASARPGEMTDYLWSALPPKMAKHFRMEYDSGRVVLIVRNSDESVDRILNEQGAIQTHREVYLA